mmetsp:Transcript_1010/g.2938  ORF Transcript_1010/g.2938 Transcript_1010/m.2938 type:complete len:218 (+) Transcript_1010:208-861(+)
MEKQGRCSHGSAMTHDAEASGGFVPAPMLTASSSVQRPNWSLISLPEPLIRSDTSTNDLPATEWSLTARSWSLSPTRPHASTGPQSPLDKSRNPATITRLSLVQPRERPSPSDISKVTSNLLSGSSMNSSGFRLRKRRWNGTCSPSSSAASGCSRGGGRNSGSPMLIGDASTCTASNSTAGSGTSSSAISSSSSPSTMLRSRSIGTRASVVPMQGPD